MSLSFLFCSTHTEKLSHPEIGAPGSSETFYPHIELHDISHLQTFWHSNPLSPLCCCTPASIRLDSPAKHSCRRSGRPNAAKRCGARRQGSVSSLILYTSKCSDLLTVLEMGEKILLQHPDDRANLKGYTRQRGKALRLLMFISDRMRIIFTSVIFTGSESATKLIFSLTRNLKIIKTIFLELLEGTHWP